MAGGTPSHDWTFPDNSKEFSTQVAKFLCPSNRTMGEVGSTVGSGSVSYKLDAGKVAVTDYLFNAGASRYVVPGCGETSRIGPVGFNTATRIAEDTNGTSNTFLMAESTGGNARNEYRSVGVGATRVCVPLSPELPSAPTATVYYDNIMYMTDGRSRTWGTVKRIICVLVARTVDQTGAPYRANDCGAESLTDLFVAPPGPAAPAAGQQVTNLRSAHPGDINAAFANGGVRVLKDTIAMPTDMDLSTMAGGEVLSADSY